MPLLTKYEKARIIGIRAAQIANNSALYLVIDPSEAKTLSVIELAEREL